MTTVRGACGFDGLQLLVRALLNEPISHLLRQMSLAHAADTIKEMTQQAEILFKHNMRVHIVRYAKIISARASG